jgi:hypothetical protein
LRRLNVDASLFAEVFREALVLDLDFSTWDTAIRMVIVAREPSSLLPSGKAPVYVVEFERVHAIRVNFSHHGMQLDSGHFSWVIDDFEIEDIEGRLRIRLWELGHLPDTFLECEDVQIRLLDAHRLYKRFPGWNKPGSPFLRGSVEQVLDEKA